MTEADWTRALCENPADDAVRMVYADWLEERGQTERSEFIRVQVELWSWDGINTGTDGGAAGPEHLALLRRQRELLAVEAAMSIPLPSGWEIRAVEQAGASDATRFIVVYHAQGKHFEADYDFRRGFVSHVSLTIADFMDHAAALFAVAPLESVRLMDRDPDDRGDPIRLYWWANGPLLGVDTPHVIPKKLFSLLRKNKYDKDTVGYPTADAAHTALSAACVRYGRELAGLPALRNSPSGTMVP